METVTKILLEQGVLGAVTVLALGWAFYKEKECRRLYERLLEKAEKMTDRYNEAVSKMSETINTLTRYEDEED